MGNGDKCNRIYEEVVRQFQGLGTGRFSPKNLQDITEKAYKMFSNGFNPTFFPEYSFPSRILYSVYEYGSLSSKRNRINIEGGEREVATEQEALLSLGHATRIADELLVPFFRDRTYFSNRIFKDIENLSYSYLDAVADGVADEYIDVDRAFEVKSSAVDVAKQAVRISDAYKTGGFSKDLASHLRRFGAFFKLTNIDLMRPFEIVSTTRKKVYRKKELIDEVCRELMKKDAEGNLLFAPDVVFPIAHGGNDVGVRIANAYEDINISPITYPLMYSMKTRKQKYPWVQNDAGFIDEDLEGKNLLIVEDWVTTGNTVRGILNKLENVYPREIRVVTLKRDPEKSRAPILDNYIFYIGRWSEYRGGKTDALSDMSDFNGDEEDNDSQ